MFKHSVLLQFLLISILHVIDHGRGRAKVKTEDSNDQVTPSAVHKKRATVESKYREITYMVNIKLLTFKWYIFHTQKKII